MSPPRNPATGLVVVVSAATAVFAIAHHPVVRHATGKADVFAQLGRLSSVDQLVHAAVIAAACGLLFGLTAFVVRRGVANGAALAGLIAYTVGTVAAIAAALIDGFLIPAIAARYATAPPEAAGTALQIVIVCALAIQIATKTWLLATSFALLAWSWVLVRLGGRPRIAGAAGVVATALVLAVLALTRTLDPHSLGVVVIAQTLWYVAVGALMIRGEL